jgi:hypothetical protein
MNRMTNFLDTSGSQVSDGHDREDAIDQASISTLLGMSNYMFRVNDILAKVSKTY